MIILFLSFSHQNEKHGLDSNGFEFREILVCEDKHLSKNRTLETRKYENIPDFCSEKKQNYQFI